jgi:hypothetical protein
MKLLRRRRAGQSTAPRRVLRDDDRQRRFDRDGYVVVPLLDEAAVAAAVDLRRRFGTAPGDPGTGLFNDTWSTDVGYKRRVMAELGALVTGPLDQVLVDHRLLGLVQIVKWPGDTGQVVAHRDPTFVDEDRHRSLGVWCALQDMTSDQGPLRVLPGSHRLPSGVRVHQSTDNLYPEVDEHLEELSTGVPLCAGEAILYDHRLIHLSEANRTDRERTVIAGILVPDEARTVYAVQTDDGPRLVEVGADFFVEHRLNELDVDRVLATCTDLGPVPAGPGPLRLDDLRALRD